VSRTGLSCAAPISRVACLSCQVLFPLAREVEVCVQEIHPEFPSTIWACLSPFTTRGGSEKFHLKPLMTPGFFPGLRFCRLARIAARPCAHQQQRGRRGDLLPRSLTSCVRQTSTLASTRPGPRRSPAWSAIGTALGSVSSRASRLGHSVVSKCAGSRLMASCTVSHDP
jgi:hypothetical protein